MCSCLDREFDELQNEYERGQIILGPSLELEECEIIVEQMPQSPSDRNAAFIIEMEECPRIEEYILLQKELMDDLNRLNQFKYDGIW